MKICTQGFIHTVVEREIVVRIMKFGTVDPIWSDQSIHTYASLDPEGHRERWKKSTKRQKRLIESYERNFVFRYLCEHGFSSGIPKKIPLVNQELRRSGSQNKIPRAASLFLSSSFHMVESNAVDKEGREAEEAQRNSVN